MGRGLVLRDAAVTLRALFLGLACRIGLLSALQRPATAEEIADRLGLAEVELLGSVLNLGAGVGELRQGRDGRWRLAGWRARALADAENDALGAYVEELLTHDAPAVAAVVDQLAGAPPVVDYLRHDPELIARSSRLVEPLLAEVVTTTVRSTGAMTVLDVGCGAGSYLRYAVEAAPDVRAVGIDIAAPAVALAQENLAAWGLDDRASVHHADLLSLPAELAGPYDLVCSLQNIYYAEMAEQPAFVAALRQAAGGDGEILIASVTKEADPFAATFDLLLRASPGDHRLPLADELGALLRSAGCADVEVTRPVPRVPLHVARGRG